MSQRYGPSIDGDPLLIVNATSGAETVQLPAGFAGGRSFFVRRTDSSGNAVTVSTVTGGSINGTTNGTTTVPGNAEVRFTAGDANAWTSIGGATSGGTPGAGTVTSTQLADAAVTAGKIASNAVGTSEITDSSVALVDLAGTVQTALAAAGTAAQRASNLSDLASPSVARTNLALPDTYAPLRKYESSPLYIYGHSYNLSPGTACTSGAEWFNRVKTRINAPSVTTYGVTSSRIIDTFQDALGTGPGAGGFAPVTGSTWVATRRGIVFLDIVMNDQCNFTAASGATDAATLSALQVTNWKDTLRTLIAVFSSSSRVETGTTTGSGWATGSATKYSGGSLARTTAQNDYVEYTVTITAAGEATILMYAVNGSTTGDAQIKVDGTTVATVPGSSAQAAGVISRRAVGTEAITPIPVRLTGLTAGSRTIRVTKTDATTNLIYIDAIFPRAATPIPVVVLKDPPAKVGNQQISNTANVAINVANRALLSPAMDTVCAEFSNVLLVDPQTPAEGLSADGIHPNDRGMTSYASAVVTALGTWTYDSDNMYSTL